MDAPLTGGNSAKRLPCPLTTAADSGRATIPEAGDRKPSRRKNCRENESGPLVDTSRTTHARTLQHRPASRNPDRSPVTRAGRRSRRRRPLLRSRAYYHALRERLG